MTAAPGTAAGERTLPRGRPALGLRPGYHSAQVDVAVRLNTNESPYPPPDGWLQDVLSETSRTDWNRYPDRRAWALRSAVGELHGVGPEQVFCANGSNEVLQCLCLGYGGPGRHVVTFEPTYALHSHIAELSGTRVVEGARNEDFSLDMDQVDRLVGGRPADSGTSDAGPVLTFLCSPNNPTGLCEDQGSVTAVMQRAAGLVVVDEAYGQFAHWSAIALVDDSTPLVVTRTYSKTWSLAGLRLGYLVGPTEVVAQCERAVLPYHLDAFTQAAGRIALRYRAEMEQAVNVIVSERHRLEKAMAALRVRVWPSEANFVLWRPEAANGSDIWAALVAHSVLVRDCSSWPGLEGCLRVTVGTPDENDRFLDALAKVLT